MQQTSPLKDIAAAIKVSGISKIDLSLDEVKLIVNTLVYDGDLEEIRGSASRFNRDVSDFSRLQDGVPTARLFTFLSCHPLRLLFLVTLDTFLVYRVRHGVETIAVCLPSGFASHGMVTVFR